jgi:hypothetical protein
MTGPPDIHGPPGTGPPGAQARGRPRLEPPPGVDVWHLGLDVDGDTAERMKKLLDRRERLRADRMRDAAAARSYVVAHGAARTVLGGYLGIAAYAVDWSVGRHGKPAFDGAWSTWQWSLSRSGRHALLAVRLTEPRCGSVRSSTDRQAELMHTSSFIDWRRVAVLVTGNALSLARDFVLLVALGWTAVQRGGTAAVTTVVLAQTVPRAVMLTIGGAAVDDRGPRFVVLRSTAARVVALVAGAAVVMTTDSFWPLVVIAVLEGVLLGLSSPATGAMMAMLATGDQLVRANSLYGTMLRAAPIVGAPVGAWLIAIGGLWQSMLVTAAVCVVLFAGLLYVTSGMTRPSPTGEENLLRRSRAGFQLLAQDRRLGWLFVSAFCLDLAFAWPLEVALPLRVANQGWGVGAVGVVVATFSTGALAAGALGVLLAHRIPLRVRLVASGLVMAVGVGAMAVMPTTVALASVAFVVGAMCGLNGPAVITAYQQAAPPARIGIAMAMIALSAVGTAPISIAFFSAISLLIGVPATWVLCGVAALAGPFAAVRALRRPAPVESREVAVAV